MKKAKDLKEFVERMDKAKKVNPKDLSSDQDLTIGIMNLISIEEHLMYSGAKTEKTGYYDLIDQIRTLRKNLMMKVIPQYEGEVWCISKHLLSSSMRLMETGTKQLSFGNKQEAYDLFDKSYELYCLFWGLNMNMLNLEDVKWVEDDIEAMKKISDKMESENIVLDSLEKIKDAKDAKKESKGVFDSLKGTIKKLVNCCIE